MGERTLGVVVKSMGLDCLGHGAALCRCVVPKAEGDAVTVD